MPDDKPELPTGWRGVLGPLDIRTGDNRILATPPDGVRMREGTIPIMWQRETGMGHDGSVIAGRADRVWVDTLGGISVVMGEGPFDLGGEDGREAARLLAEGFLTGLSIDPDEVSFEWKWFSKDGAEVDVEELDEDELWELYDAGAVEEVAVMTDWRLMGATLTPFPAFDQARIEAIADYEGAGDVVTAAGNAIAVDDTLAPTRPTPYPAEHFADPQLKRLTPLTVTDDGRVFGHIAPWNECHISYGDVCVMAPRSQTSYAYFHLGEVATTEGRLPVGKLTLGGGHADPKLGYKPALEHYDDVATAIAAVRAGEDKWGIWVAGRILPHVTAEQLEMFLLCPPSGDWRRIGGNLELVAACSVNVPGFPNVRTLAASAGGVQTAHGPLGPARSQGTSPASCAPWNAGRPGPTSSPHGSASTTPHVPTGPPLGSASCKPRSRRGICDGLRMRQQSRNQRKHAEKVQGDVERRHDQDIPTPARRRERAEPRHHQGNRGRTRMMATLASTTVPVRLTATINDRVYELVTGDLEIELGAETHSFADYVEVDVVPKNVALAIRNLLADIAGDLTTDYDLGDPVATDQPVSIGRIVHYRHFGTPGGEFSPKDSPAIVTGVVDAEAGIVSLTVFTDDGGIHPHKAVRHCEQLEGGTWHWPPRVGPEAPAAPAPWDGPRSAYEASHPPAPRPGE
jgi:hypothetical protein